PESRPKLPSPGGLPGVKGRSGWLIGALQNPLIDANRDQVWPQSAAPSRIFNPKTLSADRFSTNCGLQSSKIVLEPSARLQLELENPSCGWMARLFFQAHCLGNFADFGRSGHSA